MIFFESGCIYVAGAVGLPLLLSELPWAKGYENPTDIKYCSPTNNLGAEKVLVNFYLSSTRKQAPSFTVHTWREIGEMYIKIYNELLTIKK